MPTLSPESVTGMLALIGVAIDPARAPNVAETLNRQVNALHEAFAALPFEVEPALTLHVPGRDTK